MLSRCEIYVSGGAVQRTVSCVLQPNTSVTKGPSGNEAGVCKSLMQPEPMLGRMSICADPQGLSNPVGFLYVNPSRETGAGAAGVGWHCFTTRVCSVHKQLRCRWKHRAGEPTQKSRRHLLCASSQGRGLPPGYDKGPLMPQGKGGLMSLKTGKGATAHPACARTFWERVRGLQKRGTIHFRRVVVWSAAPPAWWSVAWELQRRM